MAPRGCPVPARPVARPAIGPSDSLARSRQDKKTLERINTLINEAAREPFAGIGKPEPLRGNLSGYWSRRIDDTHRLVYRSTESELVIIACRFHYDG